MALAVELQLPRYTVKVAQDIPSSIMRYKWLNKGNIKLIADTETEVVEEDSYELDEEED